MDALDLPDETLSQLEAIAGRYLWWPAIAQTGHTPLRLLAQLMRYGTYDDIRAVERMVSPQVLVGVLRVAEPGWFDARSWGFWRGRLSALGAAGIDMKPPQRVFAHAEPA